MGSAARSIHTTEGMGGARTPGTTLPSVAASRRKPSRREGRAARPEAERPRSTERREKKPAIWGVLNVTPDSFSDGGEHLQRDVAIARAIEMLEAGASVIDVGGESSRPKGRTYGEGASEISAAEEIARVLPVVEALSGRARVSVDTVKPEVARAALDAGASIINDVQGGRSDALLQAVAKAGAQVVLMHNRGRGEVLAPNTDYEDVVADVITELRECVARAERCGVARDRIWVDPGIGFAKTPEQSARLLRATAQLRHACGVRVLVGASRKSFIAALAPDADGSAPDPRRRLAGSLVAALEAARGGADAVRVHDVHATHQALRLACAIAEVE